MKLGRRGTRALTTVHLVFTALWVGGVAALLPVAMTVDPVDPAAARSTYLNLRTIAWNVVGWGGIGSFTTGVALGGLTSWGLFKRRWTIAKLGLTVGGVAFGMFFNERHMLAGLAVLESGAMTGTRGAAEFAAHHAAFERGLLLQLGAFALILAIAVFKPSLRLRARRWREPARGRHAFVPPDRVSAPGVVRDR